MWYRQVGCKCLPTDHRQVIPIRVYTSFFIVTPLSIRNRKILSNISELPDSFKRKLDASPRDERSLGACIPRWTNRFMTSATYHCAHWNKANWRAMFCVWRMAAECLNGSGIDPELINVSVLVILLPLALTGLLSLALDIIEVKWMFPKGWRPRLKWKKKVQPAE